MTFKVEQNGNFLPILQSVNKDLGNYFASIKGRSIFSLSVSDLNSRLKDDNRLSEFKIRKIYPDKIQVEVKLKQMALVFLDKQGGYYPVSPLGELMPSVKLKLVASQVILRGDDLKSNLTKSRKAVSLLNYMNEYELLKEKQISEITFSKADGYAVYLTNNPIVIKLGFKKLESKIKKINRVLEYLYKKDIKDCVIDARLGKKVVVKLRNET